ncbi:MAG: CBS domain-containing protein [Lachnospiraceae bacterium]|nr:CBS domain-containing protein [Lachnospiraceae bacterium]MDO5349547.1 CBS domain-containing protein [Lachnospiraceae bacterium]
MNVFQLLLTKNETMYLEENITVSTAMDQLRASGYTAVPVIREDGTYAGTVSEGDFLWAFLDGKDEDAKGQAMTLQTIVRTDRNPAVKIDVDLAQLFSEALNQNFVPVVDDRNMFIGIVTRKQVISFFMNHFNQIMDKK